MPKAWVADVEVNGQRIYITTAVRTALTALASGPQTTMVIYPTLHPRTAYVYLLGLRRMELIVHRGGTGVGATYERTERGRALQVQQEAELQGEPNDHPGPEFNPTVCDPDCHRG